MVPRLVESEIGMAIVRSEIQNMTAAANELVGLLKSLLDEIALHPESITVAVQMISAGILEVAIDSHPGDVKRLIGSKGSHIGAVRSYCKAWGMTKNLFVNVRDFNAPRDCSDRYLKFRANPNWPKDRIVNLLRGMVAAVVGPSMSPPEFISSDSENSHLVFRLPGWPPQLATAIPILANAIAKKNGHTLSVYFRPEKVVARHAIRR